MRHLGLCPRRTWRLALCTLLLQALAGADLARAQEFGPVPQPNYLNPIQLGELVAPIALYPDDLVGLVLAAATEPLQVTDAWRYLETVRAVPTTEPDPGWDDAVVALLNYPEVLERMNRDLEWTMRLGEAVELQQADVLAAIADFRARAQAAGNLASTPQQVVHGTGQAIEIQPAQPDVMYVPYYEPARVLVYQPAPVIGFYPRPYPVYHYPYAGGYPGGFANFWGIGTSFSIAWSSRRLFLRDRHPFPHYAHAPRRPGHFLRYQHDWRDRRDYRHDPRRAHEREWQPRRKRHPEHQRQRPATRPHQDAARMVAAPQAAPRTTAPRNAVNRWTRADSAATPQQAPRRYERREGAMPRPHGGYDGVGTSARPDRGLRPVQPLTPPAPHDPARTTGAPRAAFAPSARYGNEAPTRPRLPSALPNRMPHSDPARTVPRADGPYRPDWTRANRAAPMASWREGARREAGGVTQRPARMQSNSGASRGGGEGRRSGGDGRRGGGRER